MSSKTLYTYISYPLNRFMQTREFRDALAQAVCCTGGGGGGIQSIVAGTNITVDNTDPQNPIVSAAGGSTSWALTGNSGTTPGTNFVGTIGAQALVFKTNSVESMRILASNKILMGETVDQGAIKLFVYSDDKAIMGVSATNYAGHFSSGNTSTQPTLYVDRSNTSANLAEFVSPTDSVYITASGSIQASELAGVGTRMVVADSTGLMSTQSIPGGISGLTLNYLPIATSLTTLGDSALMDTGTSYRLAKSSFIVQDNIPSFQLWKDAAPTKAGQMSFNGLVSNGISLEIFNGVAWGIGLSVTADKRVGIGTATPINGFALDVVGDITFDSVLNTRAGNDISLQIGGTNAGKISFTTGMTLGQLASSGFEGLSFGHSANCGTYAEAIGMESFANTKSSALGYNAYAGGANSIAIGAWLRSTHTGAFTIGDSENGAASSYLVSSSATDGFTSSFRGGHKWFVGSATISMEILSSGKLKLYNVPTYIDNTTALAGGESAGTLYKTATGQLMIVY